MADRTYTITELCRCGNEARYTTINNARLCGVCVSDNSVVSLADGRVHELLALLAANINSMKLDLRQDVAAIIGKT